jgi:16S rRNA (cytidine1402-2'-O)-methyltransferase
MTKLTLKNDHDKISEYKMHVQPKTNQRKTIYYFCLKFIMAYLYLIPTTLGESEIESVLPSTNFLIINKLKYFIVENIRTARRFLKKVNHEINIDELVFFELNEHTDKKNLEEFLKPVHEGYDIGIISEAGCPGIADPGADVVKIAHEKNVKVIPLVGPSSILLSLMASGMNGQNFAFHGYLPAKTSERIKTIKEIEKRSVMEKQTQIFIETPYRNTKLFEDLTATLNPSTRLCIAADLTLETEYIQTKTILNWKKQKPELNKRPSIFLVYKD